MAITLKFRFMNCVWLVAGLGLAALPAAAQDDASKLSARQLFFTARPADAPAAAVPVTPAVPDVKPTPPPVKPKVKVRKPTPTPVPTAAPVQVPDPGPATSVKPEPPVSHAVVIPYLGLRYSILQDKPGSDRQEVDPERVFRSGERFYLSLESNDAAYLYVILKSSQGTWDVLFPDPDIDNGNNRLNAKSPVLVPSAANPFFFDENPGTEKLFIVLSRHPEQDLNNLIRSVKQDTPAGKAAPGGTAMASNRRTISDTDVSRFKATTELASRGIAIEGVKRASTERSGETAVYMVNTSAEDNSRVTANIVLKHQ
jgi:hypothetical protein